MRKQTRDVSGWAAASLGAGAVGTLALNAVTYADMLLTGRSPSSIPDKAAERLADRVGVDLTAAGDARADGEQRAKNRKSALGSLMGFATGLSGGAAYGLLRRRLGHPPVLLAGAATGLAVMAGSDVPAVASGLTDPKEWSAHDWLADLIPHLAYGICTVAAYEYVSDRRRGTSSRRNQCSTTRRRRWATGG